jgi:aldose 1-epimerase
MILRLLCTALLGLMFLAVFRAQGAVGLKKAAFGKTKDGQPVDLYTLTNAADMEVAITNFGGTVVSIKTPDRTGNFADVVLGFDTFDGYLNNTPFFGVVVGRYGNRIAKARFTLDGHEYRLAPNDNGNTLHGGLQGFDKRLWKAKDVSTKEVPAIQLTYLSKDGEEGFPGNLSVTVTYSLTPKNELKIDYSATTDKDTVLNLTNHSYFNLAGQGEGDILSHLMMIHAEQFTPVDATLIPTGKLQSVAGTPLDFRQPTAMGARIDASDPQMKFGRGYDHNFVLNPKDGALILAARVTEPSSGRVLEVLTTQPGVQFYTGNFLDGSVRGKAGKVYPRRSAFCLETQHFPDSPNQSQFPTTVLKPGEHFQSTTVFRFSTSK